MGDHFPMFRLATLLARQLSSPIATRIKSYATTHPVFRRALVVRAGRAYRSAELRFKLWMLQLGRPPRTPPLSEQEATQVGADIIGEFIIFSLGAAIVTFEVNRQAVNKELKELDEESQWLAILVGLEELQREVSLQQGDLDRLYDALRELAPQLPPRNTPLPPTKTPDQPLQHASEPTPQTPISSPVPLPKSSDLALKGQVEVPDVSSAQDEESALTPAPPNKRRPPYC